VGNGKCKGLRMKGNKRGRKSREGQGEGRGRKWNLGEFASLVLGG